MGEKYWIQFTKQDRLKFIGHLDLLRVFRQTVRRAGLPAAYSQGFNPHPLLGFALPLPLGMESLRDYGEIVLETPYPEEAFIAQFNACAPQGLIVMGIKAVKPGNQGLAALTAAADYRLVVGEENITAATEAAQSLLKESVLLVPKKTKSGIKETDIRPDIYDMHRESDNLRLRLAAGSARFLNPVLMAGLVYERAGLTPIPNATAMTRLELYDSGFQPLYESGGGVA